jgi:hypothetical protein
MNKFSLCILTVITAFSFKVAAQTGVNTITPAVTLEVNAKNATGSTTNVDGLLIPRVDRQRAQSMTAIPISTLIYINSIATGTATGITANVDAIGYYYYDGTFWTKLSFNANIYNIDGALGANRTVTQGANKLAFTASAVNAFSVNGTNFSVDATNSRVGIGTAAPISNLQVVGAEFRLGGPSSQTGTINNPILKIHSKANTDGLGGALYFCEDTETYGYYLKHNTAPGNINGADGLAIGALSPTSVFSRPGLFIDLNNNVGIGTANPQNIFHVDGAKDNAINAAPTVAQQANDVVITATGSMGIGTPSPSQKLHVIGNILASGSITQNSDVRLKKDIVDNAYGLKEIMELRTINYRYKDERISKDKKLGFIAQEVKTTIPELVITASDEMNTLSVNYAEMTVVLTKAIQQLQESINEIKEINKQQELKINSLKAQIRSKHEMFSK